MGFIALKKRSILYSLTSILLFVQVLHAQKIDSILAIYANVYQQERAYIQFDKPAYSPGETVWFKAYLMEGIYPSDISKNFYIDWTDDTGKILLHTTTPVVEASARGQFQVPDSFRGNVVHVKAYTAWMLNFDTDFLYRKTIRIFQKSTSKSSATIPVIPSITFFPEGGDEVVGIKNKVAFKANDQFGKPVKIKGVVVNSKNVIIDSLRSIHDGMGYFFLSPQANETYTAKWVDEQKAVHQTILPSAKLSGATLQINGKDSTRDFVITRTADASDNFQAMHIIATVQQQLVYMANVNLVAISTAHGSIPVAQLPTGVLQITLFDKNWLPVAERISFINNHDAEFTPEVGFSALGLAKRGRNILVINVPDSISCNLSVSVTDAGIGVDSTDNIISHLLMTGDLRGAVFKPSYYFSDNPSAKSDIDLVMLTHGWRRFNWDKVTHGILPDLKYTRDSSYLSLSGKIFGASPDQIRNARFIIAFVIAKDSSKETYTIPLQKNGSFYKPELVFYDTLKIFYQFPVLNMADMTEVTFFNGLLTPPKHVYIDKISAGIITMFDTTGNARNIFLAQEAQRLKFLEQGATLKEVIVKSIAKSPMQIMDDKYTSGLFNGDDNDIPFDVLHDQSAIAYPSVFNYIQGKVAGLQISIDGSNQVTLKWRGATPDVYLDEIKVDPSQISNMSMADVAYVKVFRPPFFGAQSGGDGGAIAVYTRKGNDEAITEKKKGPPYKFVGGYTTIKQFYSPDYGTFDPKNEAEDVRSTLYWNPLILTTSEKHVIHLPFYNNDLTTSFRVVLEGIAKDGRLTHIEKVVE